MARPDLDDGYVQIAYELYAAIAAADFTRGAQIVLWEIFAQIYGWAKSKTASLCPVDIAGRVGMKRPHVWRAIKELVDSNVLEVQEDGTFKFNKDHETWLRKETEGQRSYRISYAKHAPVLAKSYKYDSMEKSVPESVPHKRSLRTNPGTLSVPIQVRARTNPGTVSAPPSLLVGEKEEGRQKERASAPAATDDSLSDLVREPFDSGQPNAAPPEVQGPGKDAPEALALEEWAMQFGTDRNMEAYSHWARESCALVPAQWLRLLLSHRVLGRSGAKRATVPLLASIVADWRNAGACELERPAMPGPSANGHAPSLSKVAERDQRLKNLIDLTSPSKSKE